MKHLLIKQAIFLPVIYFGFIVVAGLFADDYSPFGQHGSMIARLDPIDLRGLTQRIFGIVVFGWFSFISYHLNKVLKNNL